MQKRKRELSKGFAVADLVRAQDIMEETGWILFASGICLLVLFSQGADWAAIPFAVLTVSGFVAIGSSLYGLPYTGAAERRESEAGYTTNWIFYQPQIDLVDPRTGLVVRAAGDPQITKAEYRSRIKAIRAATEGPNGSD